MGQGYQESSTGSDGTVTTQYFDSNGTLVNTVSVAPDVNTGGTSTTYESNITGTIATVIRDQSGQIVNITTRDADGSTADNAYFDPETGQAVGSVQVDTRPEGGWDVTVMNLQNGSSESFAYDQYGQLSSISEKSFDGTTERAITTSFDTGSGVVTGETDAYTQFFDDGSTLQGYVTWDAYGGYSESMTSTPATGTDGSTSGSSAPAASGSTFDTTSTFDDWALYQPYMYDGGWGCGGGGGGGSDLFTCMV